MPHGAPRHTLSGCMRMAMPIVLRTALLALLSAAVCCAFQTSVPVRGGSLALRGLRLTQYSRASEARPSTDPKQILIAPTSQIPLSTLSSLPITYDEQIFDAPQEFQIVVDTAVILEPTALNPAAPTRGLAALVIIFAALSLAQKIPGSHNVLAHICGGGLGGIAALFVSRPGDAMVSGRFSEKMATHGMIKGISAGCYSGLMMCLAGVSLVGLAGVAVASLGTGLVIGMLCKAVERANAIGDTIPLLTRFQTTASHGLFTQEGLFGNYSPAMAKDLAICVVQYEAFYLAWVALCMTYPWMAITFAGTAVSGALAGVASLAAGNSFSSGMTLMRSPLEFSRQCKEWWCGPVRKRTYALQAVDSSATTAVKCAALFVAYKAVYDIFLLGGFI